MFYLMKKKYVEPVLLYLKNIPPVLFLDIFWHARADGRVPVMLRK